MLLARRSYLVRSNDCDPQARLCPSVFRVFAVHSMAARSGSLGCTGRTISSKLVDEVLILPSPEPICALSEGILMSCRIACYASGKGLKCSPRMT